MKVKGEMISKETVGSPSTRRGKTSREHSVHFPDSLMTEEQEKGSPGGAEVDTVDLGRTGGSKETAMGGGEEREEQEELERVRSQMQQRERRDSLELVKEVEPTFPLTDHMFAECFYILDFILFSLPIHL